MTTTAFDDPFGDEWEEWIAQLLLDDRDEEEEGDTND